MERQSKHQGLKDLEALLRQFLGRDVDLPSRLEWREWIGQTHPSDVYIEDDRLILKCDVPGFDREELEVGYEGDEIIVKGTPHGVEADESRRTYRRRERSADSFKRRIKLEDSIQEEDIEAHLEQGVLTLTAPLSDRSMQHRIEID